MSKLQKIITRNVLLLSAVSFFTDIASEMLYPVLPLYLEHIGFSVLLIGILEGLAEATAGLSKGYFGQLSDKRGLRLPFVQLGYLLSAISKPLMAVFTFPLWVFGARTLDRLGKGVRTGARDALLSAEATSETKARVFGFHRGMDTFGAAIGPLLALVYLYFYPEAYQTLFFLAFAPGLLAVFTTFLLKEKQLQTKVKPPRIHFLSFFKFFLNSSKNYQRLVMGLLLFTLINSSDVFLLLMLKYKGLSDAWLIGVYIFYNLVYALFSYPAGILADRFGLKKLFLAGLFFFFLTYTGMAAFESIPILLGLFFSYGLYAACTQGITKAWISNIAAESEMASAIGTYDGLKSILTLLASSLAGLIWFQLGAVYLFGITAAATMVIIVYFLWIPYRVKKV